MNIKLTPDQEKIVKDELKSGNFSTVEEVIDEALQVLREREQPSTPNDVQREAVREKCSLSWRKTVRGSKESPSKS